MSELRTPMKRAVGLGSAKRGVHHFLVQRVTAIALALLCGWAVWIAITLAGLDHAAAHALVARPLHAVLAIVFAIAAFWHAQLGLQVVVEDYVHARGMQVLLQVSIRFLCFLGAAASVLAVLRIALGR